MKKVVLVLLLVFLSGCTNFSPPAQKQSLELSKGYWFQYDASRRGAFLLPKKLANQYALCAEPSPDVALQLFTSLGLNLQLPNATEVGSKLEASTQILDLARRSQTILFLRECLYRLCELSVNGNLSQERIENLYKEVLKAATEIAGVEFEKMRTKRLEKEIELKRKEIDLIRAKTRMLLEKSTNK